METTSKVKKYLAIMALGIAGGTIYVLPYIRGTFYDGFMAAMDVTNAQSAMTMTMYGIINTISYIPGGILADKIKPKWALVVSLIATGILGFLFAFTFSYVLSIIIWAGFSLSTAFIFWSALMKAVRICGTEEEQGFIYGVYYACNGVSASIASAIAVWAYGTAADSAGGFFRAVIVESIIMILASALVILFVSNTDAIETKEEDKFQFKYVGSLLKNPIVWVFSFVVFAGYGFYANVFYFTPYLTEVVGISESSAGVFSIIRSYVFLLLSPLGGLIADKLCKSTAKWLVIGDIIIGLLFIGVMMLPATISSTAASIYTLIPGAIVMMTYGVQFSTLSEAGIPRYMTGTAIGLASLIGYMPDMVYNPIFGSWLDKYGAGGYNRMFIFLAVTAFIGAVLSFIIYRTNKARLAKEGMN